MKLNDGWLLLMVAVAGIGLCLVFLVGFVGTMVNNGLAWEPDFTVRDYYLAVGQSYSQGFSVGFFLCFFLTLVAAGIRSWIEARRSRVSGEDAAPIQIRPATASATAHFSRRADAGRLNIS